MTPEKQTIIAYGDSPAFPKTAFYHPDGGLDHPQEGMTLREYFAAKAMQGLIVNSFDQYEFLAKKAVKAADTLIEQLLKPR